MAQTKKIEKLNNIIKNCDAIVIGAGSGLSTSAGYIYDGEKFKEVFQDFISKYGFTDLYSASFFDFPNENEKWAFWSRFIYHYRYAPAPKSVVKNLHNVVKDKDLFVITTNVDHLFQRCGFNKQRLFYTQGDYGLLQCSIPCHQKTYDNQELVLQMIKEEKDMRIPDNLIPHCPVCGKKMEVNLRKDDTFVQDKGWYEAAERYNKFLKQHKKDRVLYLDLGSGGNTPMIFKYPFMKMTFDNPKANYVSINLGQNILAKEIAEQSLLINQDIGEVLEELLELNH